MSIDIVHALLTGSIICLFILLLNSPKFMKDASNFVRLAVASALLFVVLVAFNTFWYQP